MRVLEDDGGLCWDVVLGRESWGAFYVLFVPREGDDEDREARKAILGASAQEEASAELSRMDRVELLELLSGSVPKGD